MTDIDALIAVGTLTLCAVLILIVRHLALRDADRFDAMTPREREEYRKEHAW